MRSFLRRHSSTYRWAVRELESDLAGQRAYIAELLEAQDFERQRLAAAAATTIASVRAVHAAEITAHDAANARLRRINRDVVTRIRSLGVPAEEYPAEKCPRCNSLAARPQTDGRHAVGIVRYSDHRVTLFCDGTEE